MKRRLISHRMLLSLLALIGVGGAIWIGHLAWHGYQLYQNLQEVRVSLSDLEKVDIKSSYALLEDTQSKFLFVHNDLKPVYLLLRPFRRLPGKMGFPANFESIMETVSGVMDAGVHAGKVILPLFEDTTVQEERLSFLQKLLLNVITSAGEIDQAQVAIQRADQSWSKVKVSMLPESWQEKATQIQPAIDVIESGLSFIEALPSLAGVDRERVYLLIAQNNDELRGGGGFITAIGTMTVRNGTVGAFEISDSYRVDDFSKPYPRPPDPIQKFMLAGYWVPRDANWSPDFPESARQIESLYTLSTGRQTDGVIAIDQQGIQGILQAIGEVNLSPNGETVNAGNVEAIMEAAWGTVPNDASVKEWWLNRKNFIGDLAKAILNHLLNEEDRSVYFSVVRETMRGMQQGHILCYFEEQRAQDLLQKAKIDGAIHFARGDYLYWIDSNIGFNKTDAVVRRSLDYLVDLSDLSAPKARLRMTYVHGGSKNAACVHEAAYGVDYDDLQDRCYWNYWRLLVNPEVELRQWQTKRIAAENLLNKEDWDGSVVSAIGEKQTKELAGLMLLPVGEETAVGLDLRLSPGMLIDQNGGKRYLLTIQKQAGVITLPVRLSIRVPKGYAFHSPTTDGWKMEGEAGVWTWTGNIMNETYWIVDMTPIQP